MTDEVLLKIGLDVSAVTRGIAQVKSDLASLRSEAGKASPVSAGSNIATPAANQDVQPREAGALSASAARTRQAAQVASIPDDASAKDRKKLTDQYDQEYKKYITDQRTALRQGTTITTSSGDPAKDDAALKAAKNRTVAAFDRGTKSVNASIDSVAADFKRSTGSSDSVARMDASRITYAKTLDGLSTATDAQRKSAEKTIAQVQRANPTSATTQGATTPVDTSLGKAKQAATTAHTEATASVSRGKQADDDLTKAKQEAAKTIRKKTTDETRTSTPQKGTGPNPPPVPPQPFEPGGRPPATPPAVPFQPFEPPPVPLQPFEQREPTVQKPIPVTNVTTTETPVAEKPEIAETRATVQKPIPVTPVEATTTPVAQRPPLTREQQQLFDGIDTADAARPFLTGRAHEGQGIPNFDYSGEDGQAVKAAILQQTQDWAKKNLPENPELFRTGNPAGELTGTSTDLSVANRHASGYRDTGLYKNDSGSRIRSYEPSRDDIQYADAAFGSKRFSESEVLVPTEKLGPEKAISPERLAAAPPAPKDTVDPYEEAERKEALAAAAKAVKAPESKRDTLPTALQNQLPNKEPVEKAAEPEIERLSPRVPVQLPTAAAGTAVKQYLKTLPEDDFNTLNASVAGKTLTVDPGQTENLAARLRAQETSNRLAQQEAEGVDKINYGRQATRFGQSASAIENLPPQGEFFPQPVKAAPAVEPILPVQGELGGTEAESGKVAALREYATKLQGAADGIPASQPEAERQKVEALQNYAKALNEAARAIGGTSGTSTEFKPKPEEPIRAGPQLPSTSESFPGAGHPGSQTRVKAEPLQGQGSLFEQRVGQNETEQNVQARIEGGASEVNILTGLAGAGGEYTEILAQIIELRAKIFAELKGILLDSKEYQGELASIASSALKEGNAVKAVNLNDPEYVAAQAEKKAQGVQQNLLVGQAQTPEEQAAQAELLRQQTTAAQKQRQLANQQQVEAGLSPQFRTPQESTGLSRLLNRVRGQDPYAGTLNDKGEAGPPRQAGASTSSLGSFFGQGVAGAIQYGLPSAVLYGGASKIHEIITESEQLQVSFKLLDDQFNTLFGAAGQQQATAFKQQILDIAQASGQSVVELANAGREITAAFGKGTGTTLTDTTATSGGKKLSGQALVTDQLQAVSEFSKVTGSSLDDTQDQFRTIGEEFGVTGKAIGDATIELQKFTSIPAGDLVTGIADSATAAKEAGFSFNQYASIVAEVDKRAGSRGVAGVAESFNRLLPAITKNRDALITLGQENDKLGKDPQFVQGIEKSKASDVVLALARNYKNLTDAQKSNAEELLGGGRNAKDLIAALQAGPEIKANTQRLDEGQGQGGLQKQYGQVIDTLSGQIDKLGAKFLNLGVALYNSGIGTIFTDATKAVTLLIRGITDILSAFGKLNDLTGGFLSTFLEVVVAAKGLETIIKFIFGEEAAGNVTNLGSKILSRLPFGGGGGGGVKSAEEIAADTFGTAETAAPVAAKVGLGTRIVGSIKNLPGRLFGTASHAGVETAEGLAEGPVAAAPGLIGSTGITSVSGAGLTEAASSIAPAAAVIATSAALNHFSEDYLQTQRGKFSGQTSNQIVQNAADGDSFFSKRSIADGVQDVKNALHDVPLLGHFIDHGDTSTDADLREVRQRLGAQAAGNSVTTFAAGSKADRKDASQFIGTLSANNENPLTGKTATGNLNSGLPQDLADILDRYKDQTGNVNGLIGVQKGKDIITPGNLKKLDEAATKGAPGAVAIKNYLDNQLKGDSELVKRFKQAQQNSSAQANISAELTGPSAEELQTLVAESATGDQGVTANAVLGAYKANIDDLTKLAQAASDSGKLDPGLAQQIAAARQQYQQFLLQTIQGQQQINAAFATLQPGFSQEGQLKQSIADQSAILNNPDIAPKDRTAAGLSEISGLQSLLQQQLSNPELSDQDKINLSQKGLALTGPQKADIATVQTRNNIEQSSGTAVALGQAYATATGRPSTGLTNALASGANIDDYIANLNKQVDIDKKALTKAQGEHGKGATAAVASANARLKSDQSLQQQLGDGGISKTISENETILAQIAAVYQKATGQNGEDFVSGIIAGFAAGGTAAAAAQTSLNQAQTDAKAQEAKDQARYDKLKPKGRTTGPPSKAASSALETLKGDQANITDLGQLGAQGEGTELGYAAVAVENSAENTQTLETQYANDQKTLLSTFETIRENRLQLYKYISGQSTNPIASTNIDIESAQGAVTAAKNQLALDQHNATTKDANGKIIAPDANGQIRAGDLGNITSAELQVAQAQAQQKQNYRDWAKAVDEQNKSVIALASAQLGQGGDGVAQIDDSIKEANIDLASAIKDSQDKTLGPAARATAAADANNIQAQILAFEENKKQLILQAMDATTGILVAQFNAVGDTVGAAKATLANDQAKLAQMKQDSAGNSDDAIKAQQQKVIEDQTAVTDAQFQDQLGDIQFNLDLKKTTTTAAINELKGMLAIYGNNKQKSQQIQEEIYQLSQQADTQFDIPANIKLPTLYEARRLDQTASQPGDPFTGTPTAQGIGYQDNRNVNIQITVQDGTTQQQMVQTLNQALGTTNNGFSTSQY